MTATTRYLLWLPEIPEGFEPEAFVGAVREYVDAHPVTWTEENVECHPGTDEAYDAPVEVAPYIRVEADWNGLTSGEIYTIEDAALYTACDEGGRATLDCYLNEALDHAVAVLA